VVSTEPNHTDTQPETRQPAPWGGQPVPFAAGPAGPGDIRQIAHTPPPLAATRTALAAVLSVDRLARLTGRRGRPEITSVLRTAPSAPRVVAVVGTSGAGRSTMAALLAAATAAHQPGPVLAMDLSLSVWPGLARRLPIGRQRELDWPRLRHMVTGDDGPAIVRTLTQAAPRADQGRRGATAPGWVARIAGLPYGTPLPAPGAHDVLRALDVARHTSWTTYLDTPADLHYMAGVAAMEADAVVVVCRADPGELRRASGVVQRLSQSVGRDLARSCVIVAVRHERGSWPRCAAAAVAAAVDAATAVIRLPYDAALADSSSPVLRAHSDTVAAAAHITAVTALISTPISGGGHR
jgi:MinD-like ATPase involved in chromosome partitioning or flagellar assembly